VQVIDEPISPRDTDREVRALRDIPRIAAILDEVCHVTRMGFAAVARVTDERWVACQVADRIEFGLQPGDELVLKTTICNDIRASGKAVIIDHVGDEPNWRTHPIPMLYGFESYASFPITLDDGQFFGTLCAIDPEPRSLRSPELVAILERFAREIAAIVVVSRAGVVSA
jgi:GAF domain-containing protein